MNQSEYRTSNLALAAAINCSSNAKLSHLDFSSQNTVFVFDTSDEPQLPDLVSAFFSRQLKADLFTYFESLKYLKTRLYEEHHA